MVTTFSDRSAMPFSVIAVNAIFCESQFQDAPQFLNLLVELVLITDTVYEIAQEKIRIKFLNHDTHAGSGVDRPGYLQ